MKVVGYQFAMEWEAPKQNLELLCDVIPLARDQGADLVVFPEMFATGFSMNLTLALASTELIQQALARLAKEYSLTILAGLAAVIDTPAGPRGQNLAMAFGSHGLKLGQYQKIHPFSFGAENLHYVGGDRLFTFTVNDVRVSPFICYDLRFPEVFRAVADSSDFIVVIASWPETRRIAWRSLLVARAIENQCYMLGINRIGSGGGLNYCGDSLFISPLGEILQDAGAASGLIGGEVDPEIVASVRAEFPFLKDRRPDVYRQW